MNVMIVYMATHVYAEYKIKIELFLFEYNIT